MDWAADGSMCGLTTEVRRFPGRDSECTKGAARPVITRGTSTRHNESDCTLGRTHLLRGVLGFDSTKHAMSLTLWHVCSCPGWLLARAVCNTGAGRCQRRRPRCRADLAAGTVKLRTLPVSSPGCSQRRPVVWSHAIHARLYQLSTVGAATPQRRQHSDNTAPLPCRRSASSIFWLCPPPPWGTAARSLPQRARRPACGCSMQSRRLRSATRTWQQHPDPRCNGTV